MLDDLDAAVAAAFERAVSALSRAGARIVELPLEMLGDYARFNIKGGLPVAAFARDEDYARLNLKLLRNTAIINFLDRCALSLPIAPPDTAPVGLMVVGRHGDDRRLLAIGQGIETALGATGKV